MSDPRFMLDIVYAKDFTSNKESVKISFRALDVAFLKAPRLGAGFKVPIRLGNGIKTTLLVKKFLSPDEHVIENKQKRQIDRSRSHRWRSNRPDNNNISFFDPSSKRPDFSKFLYGPSGVDLKVRCLEYR